MSSLGVINAAFVADEEDIKKIVIRARKVKKERRDRVRKWKNAILNSIKGGQIEKERLIRRQTELMNEEPLDAEEQKELKLIKEKLMFIRKGKLSKGDIEKKRAEILKDIMYEEEAYICPFCGINQGSPNNLQGHLKGSSPADIDKMNQPAERKPEYKDNAQNAEVLQKKLDSLPDKIDIPAPEGFNVDNIVITKDMLGLQTHHIISVDPFACNMRLARILNTAGFDVNCEENCIALPSIDAEKFCELNPKSFANISEAQKEQIVKVLMDKTGLQFHMGNHSTVIDGMSYELLLEKELAKLEKDLLSKPEKPCGDKGTPEDRKKAADELHQKVLELIQQVKNDLEMKKQGEEKFFVSTLAHTCMKQGVKQV